MHNHRVDILKLPAECQISVRVSQALTLARKEEITLCSENGAAVRHESLAAQETSCALKVKFTTGFVEVLPVSFQSRQKLNF